MVAAQLRSARARNQQARGGIGQRPRQLERDRRAQAVAEKCEGLVEIRGDGFAQRFDQLFHQIERRLAQARFTAGQSHRKHGDTRRQMLAPSAKDAGATTGVREAEQAQFRSSSALDGRKPRAGARRGGAQTKRQQLPFLRG